MRRDLWKEDKQALRSLTIDNVKAALDLPGKRWWTVGELAEECRQRRCGADHPITGRPSWFDLVPRRVQYSLVLMALRHLHADRCLGSDDGREVRVYAAMVRRPDHGPSLLTQCQEKAGAMCQIGSRSANVQKHWENDVLWNPITDANQSIP